VVFPTLHAVRQVCALMYEHGVHVCTKVRARVCVCVCVLTAHALASPSVCVACECVVG
jgi:hypothetical protein